MLHELKVALDWLRSEGQVIRHAPVAFILCVLVVFGISFAILDWHFSATDSAQRATIGLLQEELKGVSPQVAAMQARRAATRKDLLAAYVQGGDILRQFHDAYDNGKRLTPEEMTGAIARYKEWEQQTAAFLGQKFGDAARERFEDASGMPFYFWFGDQNYDAAINQLVNHRKNLSTLIETAAYDQ